MLLKERNHVAAHDILVLPRDMQHREECGEGAGPQDIRDTRLTPRATDLCLAELFVSTWFCTVCGLDLCSDCVLDMVEVRTRHLPVALFLGYVLTIRYSRGGTGRIIC